MCEDKLYLGVDIGGTAVKIGLFHGDGTKIVTNSYDVAFDNYETPIFETTKKSIETFLSDNSIDKSLLKGIGVSATGAIDSKEGIVKGAAGHIKNWVGSRIKEELTDIYSVPVEVLNDANAAALGEMWQGAARGKSDVVVVTVGTGVGGGIIVNSQILLGAKGFGGEIGHMPVNCDGDRCSCGNQGCIERYGSTTALVRMVNEQIQKGLIYKNPETKVDGCWIFKEVESDNKPVKEIVDKWIGYLSSCIVGLIHVFNPQMILIGGGISAQEDHFIEPLRQKIMANAMPHFTRDLEIKRTMLGNEAGMVGAVYFCIQNN